MGISHTELHDSTPFGVWDFPPRKGIKLGSLFTVEFEQQLISVLLTGLLGGGVIAAVIGAVSSRRGNLSKAYDDITSTLEKLSKQVKSQQTDIDELKGHIANLEAMKDELERDNQGYASYIRELFHWLNKLCPYLDPEFSRKNPKPRLPDELRPKIGKDLT